jgi:hypothetical protein
VKVAIFKRYRTVTGTNEPYRDRYRFLFVLNARFFKMINKTKTQNIIKLTIGQGNGNETERYVTARYGTVTVTVTLENHNFHCILFF